MKVLHICTESGWGGGEKQAMQLVDGCKDLGLQTAVFCADDTPVHKYCHRSATNFYLTKSRSPYHPWSVLKLFQTIRHFDPDILHIHASRAHTLVLITSLFLTPVPIVLSRRNNMPIKKNLFSNWKYNHHLIKRIICVSNAVENTLAQHITNPSKLITIYGGLNIQDTLRRTNRQFLKQGFPELVGHHVIGFVGALTDLKDPQTFIDTADLLIKADRSLRFVMIGDGSLWKKVQKQLKSKSLSNHVLLIGFEEANIEALSALDLLLITSKSEGLPNVILEAAALRVPIVSTNVGGVGEFILHEITGMTSVSPRPDLLAEDCLKVLKDPVLKVRLTEAAYAKVQSFSHQNGIDQTVEIYRQLVNK